MRPQSSLLAHTLDKNTNFNHVKVNEATGKESAPDYQDAKKALKNILLQNQNGLAIAYLIINSKRNKFEFLMHMISDSTDTLVICRTKIHSSFTTRQFLIEGFIKRFRYD